MYFQDHIVTDNWKESFPFNEEIPHFFVDYAVVTIPTGDKCETRLIGIEFFDSSQKLVIRTEYTATKGFCIELREVDLEDTSNRWVKNNFSLTTKPIYFYDNVDCVQISNIGTENWYEFILSEDGTDHVAVINSRSFELSLITK